MPLENGAVDWAGRGKNRDAPSKAGLLIPVSRRSL